MSGIRVSEAMATKPTVPASSLTQSTLMIARPSLPADTMAVIKAKLETAHCDADTGRGCVWVNTATRVYYSSPPDQDKDAPSVRFRVLSSPEADAAGYTRAIDRSER